MARKSKFSLGLSGRKAESTRNVSEVGSIVGDRNYTQNTRGMSKAERFLGTPNIPNSSQSEAGSLKFGASHGASQISLQSKPSLVSVTISGEPYDQSPDIDPTADSSNTLEALGIPLPSQSLNQRASSNLLGEAYNADAARSGSASTTTVTHQMHYQHSSSTLRSYYDAQMSPLAISQQTSASSARDMALRKGKPTVREIVGYDDEYEEILSQAHAKHQQLKQDTSKKRPSRLDLTKLFPKPKGHNSSLLSPTKVTHSPSALSNYSEYFPPPSSAASTGTFPSRKGSVDTATTVSDQQSTRQKVFDRDIYSNAKVNVRRPPKGIQHWFDGFDDEDEVDDDLTPGVEKEDPYLRNTSSRSTNRSAARASSRHSAIPDNHQSHKRESIIHGHMVVPERQSSARRGSDHSIHSHLTGMSTRTRESRLSVSNLCDNSVLALSSSEDEDDPAKQLSPVDIRASLAERSDMSTEDEIIIGDAQKVSARSVGRPKALNCLPRRPGEVNGALLSPSLTSLDSPVLPHQTFLAVPPSRSRKRQSGQFRPPSFIQEAESRPKSSSARLSRSGQSIKSFSTLDPGSPTNSAYSEPQFGSEESRVMVVTAEEETLLELMRRKRASMQRVNLTDSYKLALAQHEKIQRANSAATSKARHTAFIRLDSPEGISFPSPPNSAQSSRPPSHTSKRLSRLDEEDSFPDVPRSVPQPKTKLQQRAPPPLGDLNRQPLRSFPASSDVDSVHLERARYAPKTSPSFSKRVESLNYRLSPDSLPSPTAHHASPATPTPLSEASLSYFPTPPLERKSPAPSGPLDFDLGLDQDSQASDTYSIHNDSVHTQHASISTKDEQNSLSNDSGIGVAYSPSVPTFAEAPSSSNSTTPIMLPVMVHSRGPSPIAEKVSELNPFDGQFSKKSERRRTASSGQVIYEGAQQALRASSKRGTGMATGGAKRHMHRDSVNDDVLAAWGELGGWRDLGRVKVGRF